MKLQDLQPSMGSTRPAYRNVAQVPATARPQAVVTRPVGSLWRRCSPGF